MIKRKASWTYDGIKEDSKTQKVPVPSKGKVDNSRGPLGYNHGVGEEDREHGPGVTPNPDKQINQGKRGAVITVPFFFDLIYCFQRKLQKCN